MRFGKNLIIKDFNDKLKSLQDSGVSIRTRNLIPWGLVKTALMPIWAKKQELVTEGDEESSSKKEVMYDVVEEPAMKVLPIAPPEDRLIAVAPYFNSGSVPPHRMTLHQDSQKIQTGIVLGPCDSAFGRAEAGDLEALSAFPMIVNGLRNVHEPLPFSLYEDLKRSIIENGLKSPYTNGLFQAITDSYRMAPCDWIALARTVLTPAQLTVWHSEYSW